MESHWIEEKMRDYHYLCRYATTERLFRDICLSSDGLALHGLHHLGRGFPDESLLGQENVRQEDLSIRNGFQYRQWCPRDYHDHGTERRMVARRLVSLGQFT